MRARRAHAWGAAAALSGALLGASCEGSAPPDEARFATLRERMVREQIAARGVRDSRVLEAMRTVPRHRFVPEALRDRAYADAPLPIGLDQTISQPYVVAAMTEALQAAPGDVVLEVGTGSGYQAAVLARLVRRVVTIELLAPLAERARATLRALDVENVEVVVGDGWKGVPSRAPFDGILVTAAPDTVPPELLAQLAVGGRLVIPVGRGDEQELRVVTRTPAGFETETLFGVRFVPLVHGDAP
jgi:protein-L-isoaspartate(D-aspartate) O-methyltransferase